MTMQQSKNNFIYNLNNPNITHTMTVNEDILLEPQYPLDNKLKNQLPTYFEHEQVNNYNLWLEKHKRYGLENIHNHLEDDKDDSIRNIIVRMNDKMNRLKQLLKNPELQNGTDESIEDTLRDLSNYSIIAILVQKDLWK